MADLLLELFSEEIPARMQAEAAQHLQKSLGEKLGQSAKGFSTPRRIAAIVNNLPAMQPDISTELKGPKIGAPQQAIDGFLKKSGMKLEQLAQQDGIYVARIFQKGKPTAEVLKPLIEEILKSFPWPKSMRWGSGSAAWVRPLHGILCILGGEIVPVEFAGVTAGNITHGHRFLSPGAITIKKPADYENVLEKAHVIADRDKRKAEILKQINTICSTGDWRLKTDDYLLEEVTGLVEWPVVLMGAIDKQFMDLPPEVLTTVMKKHQKYFSLLSSPHRGEAGRGAQLTPSEQVSPHPNPPPAGEGILAPHFLVVANMAAKDGGKAIVAGNERVLRARFADARFFWDQDRKKNLDEWAAGLKDVTFHAKLGTVADKVTRIAALARVILSEAKDLMQQEDSSPAAQNDKVQRAARLCKADLITGMVGEFAELQGIMGRYYALAQGEKPEVADAIRDHYKPQGPGDSVPGAPVSVCVALADKLDTLVSMFSIGEKPTGSKDPFALRRAALGVIRIVLENNVRLPLNVILSAAKNLKKDPSASPQDDILSFFHDRLIVQMKDSGIRHDVIKAVVADGDDDLVRIVNRAKAVQEFLETDDGKNLLAGYKRAANILAIEEKKDKITYSADKLNPELLREKEEKELSMFLGKTANMLEDLRQKERFTEMMKELATLRVHIDWFFDKVMVNDENKELRIERLRLLARIRDFVDCIADFSAIEGDSKEQKKAA